MGKCAFFSNHLCSRWLLFTFWPPLPSSSGSLYPSRRSPKLKVPRTSLLGIWIIRRIALRGKNFICFFFFTENPISSIERSIWSSALLALFFSHHLIERFSKGAKSDDLPLFPILTSATLLCLSSITDRLKKNWWGISTYVGQSKLKSYQKC